MSYFRYIIYFLLGIIENTINFLFSIIHIYPKVDITYYFWDATNNWTKQRFLDSIKNGKDVS
jgi:hypothetical protein